MQRVCFLMQEMFLNARRCFNVGGCFSIQGEFLNAFLFNLYFKLAKTSRIHIAGHMACT